MLVRDQPAENVWKVYFVKKLQWGNETRKFGIKQLGATSGL